MDVYYVIILYIHTMNSRLPRWRCWEHPSVFHVPRPTLQALVLATAAQEGLKASTLQI